MTDERSPLDVALDLMLYAPIGLALTMGEEVPKLAAKGRSRLTTRWTTAKVVGQLAVAQGKKEVVRRTGGGAPKPPAAAPTIPPTPATTSSPVPATPAGRAPSPTAATSASAVTETSSTPGAAPRASAATNGAATAAPAPAVASLAIPGYDSLSASQVVQRLAGLDSHELEAVRAYEAATRSRRTILARASQLQGS